MWLRVLGSAAGGGFPQWNCSCPACHAPLVARKGGVVAHHFVEPLARLAVHRFEAGAQLGDGLADQVRQLAGGGIVLRRAISTAGYLVPRFCDITLPHLRWTLRGATGGRAGAIDIVIDPGSNGGNASLFGAWFTYDTIAGGPRKTPIGSISEYHPPVSPMNLKYDAGSSRPHDALTSRSRSDGGTIRKTGEHRYELPLEGGKTYIVARK